MSTLYTILDIDHSRTCASLGKGDVKACNCDLEILVEREDGKVFLIDQHGHKLRSFDVRH